MRIIALEYHDIVRAGAWDESGFPGASAATYKLPVDLFEAHLNTLQESGSVVVSEVANGIDGSIAPPVMLTFDDGGVGYVRHAADMLEARGWRGIVFMTTGEIGRPGFLASSDLQDLHRRGHVIGSHSKNHPPRLSALPRAAVEEEWRTSLSELSDILGQAVRVASVPGGHHSSMVAESAQANGITTLFTSEPEVSVRAIGDCRVVGRFTLRRDHAASYVGRLVGRAPFARSMQWCQWNAKKVAKVLGGQQYLRIRDRVFGR